MTSLAALEFGVAVLSVSGLSFLGYGADPPTPEWGLLVADGRDYVAASWWLSALPGLTIALTVLSVNHITRTVEGERGAVRARAGCAVVAGVLQRCKKDRRH